MSLTKNNLDKSIQLRCHKCRNLLLQRNLSNYFPKHEEGNSSDVDNNDYKYEGNCCDMIHLIEITCSKRHNLDLIPLKLSSFKKEGKEVKGRVLYESLNRTGILYLITDSRLDPDEKVSECTIVYISQEYYPVKEEFSMLMRLHGLCIPVFLFIFIVGSTLKYFWRLIEMMFLMTLFFILINELLLMARNSDLNTNKPIEPIFNTSIVPYLNSIGEEIGTKLDGIKERTPLEFLFRETKKETLPFPLPTCFTIPPWSEDVYELGYSGLEKCCFADDEECSNKGELGLCLVSTRIYRGDEPIFRNARRGECRFEKVNGKGGKGFRNLKN